MVDGANILQADLMLIHKFEVLAKKKTVKVCPIRCVLFSADCLNKSHLSPGEAAVHLDQSEPKIPTLLD